MLWRIFEAHVTILCLVYRGSHFGRYCYLLLRYSALQYHGITKAPGPCPQSSVTCIPQCIRKGSRPKKVNAGLLHCGTNLLGQSKAGVFGKAALSTEPIKSELQGLLHSSAYGEPPWWLMVSDRQACDASNRAGCSQSMDLSLQTEHELASWVMSYITRALIRD